MIIAIVGPTAVGKTKLSIELAHKYNAIVINCDAMQVYRGLNIGTAKVTEEEKEGVPHYLFDIRNVNEEYTVFDYQKDVSRLLNEFYDRNIILVGGTGLYLKAALYDYRFLEEDKDDYDDYSEYSNEELYRMALEKDPNCDIHQNNRVRLERFLNKKNHKKIEPVKLYDFKLIGLTTDRDVLYNRIDNRVLSMMENGLLEEVKELYDEGIRTRVLERGIGYKELFDYFDGKVSLEEATQNIQKNSRHYAKRQYTFFNNQFDVKWFSVNFYDFNVTVKEVIDYIEEVE